MAYKTTRQDKLMSRARISRALLGKPRPSLTDEQVREIRRLYKTKTDFAVAREVGCSVRTVERIGRRQTRADVPD